MKKSKKKWILILSIAAVLAAAAVVLFILKPFSSGTVNVYPVSELASGDYYEDATESSGYVKAKGYQRIMLSDTQTVKEILVSEGQRVSKGDAVLAYDSTLSDIELEKAHLFVLEQQLNLQKANEALAEINSLVPASEKLIRPDNSWIHYDPVTTPYIMSGKGTKEDPMYLIINKKDVFTSDYIESFLPEDAETFYGVFMTRKHNAVNGKIQNSFGLVIYYDEETDSYSFKPYVPDIPDSIKKYDKPKKPYYKHIGSDYTQAEIVSMRQEKEAEIKELTLALKAAELEYKQKKKEANNNVVRATINGEVRAVRNPSSAYKDGEPVVEISSGGGFVANVAISELQIGQMNIGDTVTVTSYNSGNSCEGTIQSISSTPTQNADAWTNGNSNISYYPCTVKIDGEEDLEPGEYISVQFSAASQSDDSFYLESMFIRRDASGPYVYAKGENGRLQKRSLSTGRILYGSMTQIKEGLTMEDFIAFPYGKKVKEGTATQEAELSELYN